ncbi:MAG: carboxylesterase family protein [Myxococcota bacterium]
MGDQKASDTGRDGSTDLDTDLPEEEDTSIPEDTDEPELPNTVHLDAGPIVGVPTAAGAIAFLGLPFAAPPVGALRFRPPEPPSPWTDSLIADTFAPACIQFDADTDQVRGEEDCLYLNVWQPPKPTSEPMPVLVFIHGGGNVIGSAVEETAEGIILYDGAEIAVQEEALVVTLQYRLNAFGYLADPSLDTDIKSGNYGPRDQVAALEWVQRNIAAFGGDPQRVLLFGESGGAADVCALLATPSSAGLFQRAAIMSGGCGGYARAEMLEMGSVVVEALGCDTASDRAACLRSADAAQIVEAVNQPSTANGLITAWAGPTIDGEFLPQSPAVAIAFGQHHRVPLMIGTTADETASPLFGIRFTLTAAQYEANVRAFFPSSADQVLERYPVTDFATPRDALVAVTTDAQFTCPSLLITALAAEWGPVFHYIYAHAYDGDFTGVFSPSVYGAAHGFELPLLFQTLDTYDGYTPSDEESALSQEMGALWAGFAADGAPSDATAWPPYDATRQTLELSTSSQVVEDYRGEQCRFWLGL